MCVEGRRTTGVRQGDSNLMLATKVIVSSVLAAALFALLPKTAKSETLDSGIFGVVPDQQLLVQSQQRTIADTRSSSAFPYGQQHKTEMQRLLDQEENVLSDMQNRCVRAFDPKSELPAAYPWPAFDLIGTTGLGSCSDLKRFPHGFTKLLAAGPCGKDGSFRLTLGPGHYAVYVGRTPGAPGAARGPGGWWQYVDIAPHQWLQMTLPKDDYGAPCESDADCRRGALKCREIRLSQDTVHSCLPRIRSKPPVYDSGVRGRLGKPNSPCYGNPPGPPALMPGEKYPGDRSQCIEAFREGETNMAACAACRSNDGDFVLPLPPGRYVLQLSYESRAVDVAAGQWTELYLYGAKPGPVQFPTCVGLP
jgi:hypothetical protein